MVELTSTVGAELVPIDGAEVKALIDKYNFFAPDLIPAGTYDGIGDTKTISVGAQWVVGSDVDEQLVYDITQALWNDKTRTLLDKGHAKGQMITLESALDGIGIPLHPGAERFYKEIGRL